MMETNHLHLQALAGKEWLYTNGLGGYAASTIAGINTRRYHGLLVAAMHPPTDRRVWVSKVEEQIRIEDKIVALSTNYFPGTVHPEGYLHLQSFSRDPLPCATFAALGATLTKTVWMVQGQNTTVVEYANVGNQALGLHLRPLWVYRGYHSLFHQDARMDFYTEEMEARSYRVYPHYGATPVYFSYAKGRFMPESFWYFHFEYPKEQYRGLDFQEDARSLGSIDTVLAPGEKQVLIFSTEAEGLLQRPEESKNREIQFRESLKPATKDKFWQDLAVSGNQFLVHRQSSQSSTLIAGYHWFTDWGRDTMIAMRGLTIAAGHKEVSASLLRTFLQYLDQGMLPNVFPDQGETPEYNTIDATLWLFVVLYEYYEQFEDLAFIAEVFPKLEEILNAYRKGTRYGIHQGSEGLIWGGEGLAQLTWMDAKVGDFVVTPRHGCPVEINALWYNALCIGAFFAQKLGRPFAALQAEKETFPALFRRYFLNAQGYLHDVVQPESAFDASIRPNQLYALSLPFPLLAGEEAQRVLEIVQQHLYTDLGLRSLSPQDTQFRETYGGDAWQRDSAYHQGTVWAFLWGEYALAYLRQHDYSETACSGIRNQMQRFETHFYQEAGLECISEIFDGLHPDEGRGCVQQAWSVGMLLKVLHEIARHSVKPRQNAEVPELQKS